MVKMTLVTRTPSNAVEGALVDAAERLLEAEGVEALSVRRIAAEAGVAPMGVYNRFGGKNGVLDALLIRGFEGLGAAMADVPTGDPIVVLTESGSCYRQFAKAHPAMYRLMFDRAIAGWEPSAEALAHSEASFQCLVGNVRQAMDAGLIRPDDEVEVAQRLWSACHGLVSLELRGLGFVADVDTHHRRLTETMLAGLAAPPSEAQVG
jgi:AcrR family transcriptional regulator